MGDQCSAWARSVSWLVDQTASCIERKYISGEILVVEKNDKSEHGLTSCWEKGLREPSKEAKPQPL
jgi:hypothetical protein